MSHQSPVSVGWEFEANSDGVFTPVRFTTTGNYSFDLSREVTRTINGLTLMPDDRENLDFSSVRVVPYLVLDGVRHEMSTFAFVEDIEQRGVVLNPNDPSKPSNVTNVALADESTTLIRNTGRPETLNAGFNPTAELERMVLEAGMRVSTEANASANTQTVTWDGQATVLSKVKQLAELAGHQTPWLDNFGVIRSVLASRVFGPVLELGTDLFPAEASLVTVTNNYLTIPNRVIVTSNASPDFQVIGIWNAPASWPSSAAQRGYVRTELVEVQGVYSNTDAEKVAATIGQRLSARKLTMDIMPTHLLDGPRVLRYDDALWTVKSWSMGTAAGSALSFEAEELIAPSEEILGAPTEAMGVI